MRPIAHIHSDFATKFGIPRQSGVVGSLQAEIIFEPEFRSRDAVRGLEAFSHIWLIWEFSENVRADWSPTVRPPRLGGNVRMGVFATRSRFRPNPIGLSCVRLEDITFSDARGPVLHVAGADLMDGTPIYDIKPYIPYADCHPEATEGFTGQVEMQALTVEIPPELLARFRRRWPELAPLPGAACAALGDGPAVYYTVPGWKGDIGFIAAVHGKFCASCNRVRLTSQGFLRPCLASEAGCDLKALLRSGAADEELLTAIRTTIWEKPQEHHFELKQDIPATRGMYRIGG